MCVCTVFVLLCGLFCSIFRKSSFANYLLWTNKKEEEKEEIKKCVGEKPFKWLLGRRFVWRSSTHYTIYYSKIWNTTRHGHINISKFVKIEIDVTFECAMVFLPLPLLFDYFFYLNFSFLTGSHSFDRQWMAWHERARLEK